MARKRLSLTISAEQEEVEVVRIALRDLYDRLDLLLGSSELEWAYRISAVGSRVVDGTRSSVQTHGRSRGVGFSP